MSATKFPVTANNLCVNPGNHALHMCTLGEAGLIEEVRKRANNPAYACFNCGARANEEGDLCNPTPLRA